MVHSPESPLSSNWDRSLEDLPDCRLAGPRRRSTLVPFGRMMMEKVYCANCGCDGGMVTAEWSPHVFYLCETCAHGNTPPGCIEVKPNV